MTQELTPRAAESGLVPAGYAEKAMASLLQLHNELMDEKERRVALFRQLMEKEQAVAELNMYVKMLEEKLAERSLRKAPRPPPPPPKVVTLRTAVAPTPPASSSSVPVSEPAVASLRSAQVTPLRAVPRPPPPPPARPSTSLGRAKKAASDGWKTW